MPGTVPISGVSVMNDTEDKVSVFLELTFSVGGEREGTVIMSGGSECNE